MRRHHAISPGFSGHYQDLGIISSLQGHHYACNLFLAWLGCFSPKANDLRAGVELTERDAGWSRASLASRGLRLSAGGLGRSFVSTSAPITCAPLSSPAHISMKPDCWYLRLPLALPLWSGVYNARVLHAQRSTSCVLACSPLAALAHAAHCAQRSAARWGYCCCCCCCRRCQRTQISSLCDQVSRAMSRCDGGTRSWPTFPAPAN